MLCQFSVKNYRSIKEEVTLDMQAVAISEHKDHILTCADGKKFLPVAVVYGPNGSGKSNVLRGIHDMLWRIKAPICAVCPQSKEKNCQGISNPTPINPFTFSGETVNAPTEFEIFFRTEQAEYKYNINIFNDEVAHESLSRKKFGDAKHSLLFKRGAAPKNEIKMGAQFKGLKVSEIGTKLPLLSYLAITYSGNEVVFDILWWLESKLRVLNFANPVMELSFNVTMLKEHKNMILRILKEIDIDVDDYEIVKKGNDDYKIYTMHNVLDKCIGFGLQEESDGTIKLFSVIPIVIDCLKNGSTLIIDELDSQLHPKLLEYIIKLFTNKAINTKNAQLIFTSHDLATMNSNIFRRDEIWFTAKNAEQSTSLYSLVEFRDKGGKTPRNDARYDKQYLEGRYGADPYLRKIIDWEARTE